MIKQVLVCQIDHLVTRNGALFGYGWALIEHTRFKHGSLMLTFADGRLITVMVYINRERKDVCELYPNIQHAEHSGFMFLAGWIGEGPIEGRLQFTSPSGELYHYEFNITLASSHLSSTSFASLKSHSQRAWRLLKNSNFEELVGKGRRRLKAIGGFSRKGTPSELQRLIGDLPSRLIIDHRMGGGANLYRDRVVQDWLDASTNSVILLSFSLYQMRYLLEIRQQGKLYRRWVNDFEVINKVMSCIRLREVFVNCFVSFPEIHFVEQAVYNWVRDSKANLIVVIHDFFMVCPSHFLLDRHGKYCGIPTDLNECQECLGQHLDGFVSLTAERSMISWRRAKGELLIKADEVRCFSASSLELIQRAYPELNKQLTITPHKVKCLRIPQLSSRRAGDPLIVGVVGSISEHKGALVVESLSRAIDESGLPVRIVIVGTLYSNISRNGLIETGMYQTEELPDLFERFGIHLALMPSICPETFSFVTHELISMHVPIACLSRGAQKEAVSRYAYGHILLADDGPGILAELIAFADHPRQD